MLFGGVWKILGYWTREVVGCFKQDLVSHLSRSIEDSAEDEVDWEDQLKEFQSGRVLMSVTETILVIFWQNMLLPFALVLKICLRLTEEFRLMV